MVKNTKTVENKLTPEEWVELGKELARWESRGPLTCWGTRESTKEVDIFIKEKYGMVNYENYRDYDLLENRLVYLTIKNICDIRDFIEKTKSYSLRGIEHKLKVYENNVKVPYYLLQKPYGIERLKRVQGINRILYEDLIRLCTKYLRSIGIETNIN